MTNSSPRSPASWMEWVRSNPSLRAALAPRLTSVIPHRPTATQAAFLVLDDREALFGGAAGGGKSEALLMGALQYVDIPEYSALLLRRRLTDSSLPGAILDRAHEWLADSGAQWRESERSYHFPSGATVTFGYLDHPIDRFRYQSSEFQYIGFDELTQFAEVDYTYLFSRLRRRTEMAVPLRMRSASNPGGAGHDWVRRRFLVEGPSAGRRFIPSRLSDNPHLDHEEYRQSLESLDRRTRAQLLDGDWDTHDDSVIPADDIAGCESDCLWSVDRPTGRMDLYVGIDIGRTHDLTVIWTWEKVGDVFWCRDLAVLSRMNFREQSEEIRRRLNPSVGKCLIDKGGIGFQLAEELERDRPGVVEGVHLTRGMQVRLAQRMSLAFGERRVRIPADDGLRTDLRTVRRSGPGALADRILTPRTDTGHADRFWAAALGLEAAANAGDFGTAVGTPLPQSYRPKGSNFERKIIDGPR